MQIRDLRAKLELNAVAAVQSNSLRERNKQHVTMRVSRRFASSTVPVLSRTMQDLSLDNTNFDSVPVTAGGG